MKIKNINNHPFALYSAEEEKKFLSEIFFEPSYYKELQDVVMGGASRLLVGQRGFGKSATIYSLFQDLPAKCTLPILVRKYDGVPINDNESYFLCIILKGITNEIAKHLFKNNADRKKLNDHQKERLSFFIELFYDPDTATYYIEKAKEIQNKKKCIKICSLFNKNLKMINYLLNFAHNFTTSLLRESIQIPPITESNQCLKDFLHEINVPEIRSLSWEKITSAKIDTLKIYLQQLIEISNSIGYKSVVVLFDGIDEYKALTSTAEISNFTESILKDTNLLYMDKLSIVFSLWSEIKVALNNKGVRFDKFPQILIEWTNNELEHLIDKRLKYFSIDRDNPVTLGVLIQEQSYKNQVIELAHKSPRALIELLNKISYKELADEIETFSVSSITDGIMDYCKSYDYLALCPINIKNDFPSWLNKLLSIRLCDFTIEQMMNALNIKSNTAQTYISEFKKRGLLTVSDYQENGNNIYKIIDPRLRYLVSKGITEL